MVGQPGAEGIVWAGLALGQDAEASVQPGVAGGAGLGAGLVGIVGTGHDETPSAGALRSQGERGGQRVAPDGVVQGDSVVGLEPVDQIDDPVVASGASLLAGLGDPV